MNIKIKMQNDVWMGNGIENLYRLLHNIEGCSVEIDNNSLNIEISDKEKFLRNFTQKIKNQQDKTIFVTKRDEKGQVGYVKKDFVLVQYGKAINGRNVLKEKIYSETEKRLNEIFSNIEEGNKICVICGRKFKKSVDKLKQAVYPFVTKIKSLSGIRILKENYDNVCPLCYLVGTLEWLDESIIYRCFLGSRERTYSVIFLPFEYNLKKLHESKKYYIEILAPTKDSQISNLLKIKKTERGEVKIGYEGEFTTALRFFEKFVSKILEKYKEKKIEFFDELFGEIERTVCKSWIIVKIPSGQVKNVKYQQLELNDEILNVIIYLENQGIFIYDNILDKINIFSKDGKFLQNETNNVREKLAKSIIKNNFREFPRSFLPRKYKITIKRDSFKDLNELIKLWRLDKMGLKEHLEDIKSAGNCLAKLLEGHLGILYAMDKARTKEEFVRALEQASKRLVGLKEEEIRGEMKPSSLVKITEIVYNINNWQELRDILLIYTSVFYSIKNK